MPLHYYYLYMTFDIGGGTAMTSTVPFLGMKNKLSAGLAIEYYLVDETGKICASHTYCLYQGYFNPDKLQGLIEKFSGDDWHRLNE